MVHLLKLFRLLRLFRLLTRTTRVSQYGTAVLLLLMFGFSLIGHWLACLFFAIAILERVSWIACAVPLVVTSSLFVTCFESILR